MVAIVLLLLLAIICSITVGPVEASEDAKRLLDDLFSDYNSVVRPVSNPTDKIKLSIGLKLSQIAEIDMKNQVMTTNVWLRHEWYDHKLTWIPEHYGNTSKINIPSTSIWLPDIVLYNNAEGDYQVTTKTKATVHNDGKIIWEPPMIYKSYCAIDIEYYPFDIQDCYMKFGLWTFDGDQVDLEHVNMNNSIKEESASSSSSASASGGGTDEVEKRVSAKLYTVEMGIDMSDYYQSVEWDVLSIPAQKNIKVYDCCTTPYFDIYFNITIRRKTLFYTVNLIIPCVNISFLSVLVFYLPSDSGEKLTLGISILVALLVFYLLLIELIPPTSLVIPLLGKYLLFTLILVNLSILLTIFVLNLYHRKPKTHKMPTWMRRLVVEILPKLLMIERPIMAIELSSTGDETAATAAASAAANAAANCDIGDVEQQQQQQHAAGESDNMINKSSSNNNKKSKSMTSLLSLTDYSTTFIKRLNENIETEKLNDEERLLLYKRLVADSNMRRKRYPDVINDAFDGIEYMHEQMCKEREDNKEIDDWKYASMVIDRLLLWIFTVACFIGTFGILLQAPSIYDNRNPINHLTAK